MFHDLDATLQNLLDAATFPAPLSPVDVSFKRPDSTVTFNNATICLFLYGVKENRLLRDPVPIVSFSNGSFRRRQPPMRVDCDYLVTAWHTGLALDLAVAAEHQLLALALTELSRYPVVPTAMLAGGLQNQPFPVQLWAAQGDDSKQLGEFWSSLGISPRAAFHLTATIALDPGVETIEGPPVTTAVRSLDDDLDRATPGELSFAFGGTVRDAEGNRVAGAEVTLDGARTVLTGADGRYRFGGVPVGNHTIAVVKNGAAGGGAVTIPPDPAAQPPPTLTDFDFTL